jgi:hypothetical protein
MIGHYSAAAPSIEPLEITGFNLGCGAPWYDLHILVLQAGSTRNLTRKEPERSRNDGDDQ